MPLLSLDSFFDLFDNPKVMLAIFIILMIAIPAGSLAVRQGLNFGIKGANNPEYKSSVTQEASLSAEQDTDTLPLSELRKKLEAQAGDQTEESADLEEEPSSIPEVSFGPTLDFAISIEGRPSENQSAKVFLGLADGTETTNPKYLLSFNVDVPASGSYSKISIAGLDINKTYTAYIKPIAQIASSSTFTAKSTVTKLNNALPINLTTGDLNDDNVIDSLDYNIAKTALGSSSLSPKWNALADFNLDGFINLFDLSIISKNLNKVGAGGAYTSPVASGSAIQRDSNVGSPSGYWLFVPQY